MFLMELRTLLLLLLLNNAAEYEIYFFSSKFNVISRQVSLDLLLGVSAGIYQRALVDESGMTVLGWRRTVGQKWSQ
jgi:hypothetical protein